MDLTFAVGVTLVMVSIVVEATFGDEVSLAEEAEWLVLFLVVVVTVESKEAIESIFRFYFFANTAFELF